MIAARSLPVLALLSLLQLAACGGGSLLGARPRGAEPGAAPVLAGTGADEAARTPAAEERPGLGTRFGEDRYSPVHDVAFERQGGAAFLATVHYDDRQGVAALRSRAGRLVPCAAGEPWLEGPRGPFGGVVIEVVDEDGRPLRAYHVGGRVLIEGEAGRRYALRVENRTSARFEIVASVDGLDVIDGGSASPAKRGYVVAPHGRLEIEGFRRSVSDVAAFRFGAVRDSYAARTAESGDRNVGVIGVALFAERGAEWVSPDRDREAARREDADPFPGPGPVRFAQPPN